MQKIIRETKAQVQQVGFSRINLAGKFWHMNMLKNKPDIETFKITKMKHNKSI